MLISGRLKITTSKPDDVLLKNRASYNREFRQLSSARS